MKSTLRLLGLILPAFVIVNANADVKTFDSYPHPQLLQDNDKAFEARLHLLDNAPSGSTVKVATFVFEYGERVKQLSSHLCKASKRGVHVELLVDSKSGDRVDQEDAFDSTEEIKKNEQIYAYLATCGAKVYIHNSIAPYVTFFGKKLPNFFGVKDGTSIGIKTLLSRIDNIQDRLSDGVVQPVLNKLGVKTKFKDLFGDIRSLALNILHFTGIAGFEDQGDKGATPSDAITNRYKNLVQNKIWAELDVPKARVLTDTLKDTFMNDPGDGKVSLKDVYGTLRRYNRLNHRKLFLIETADKSQGCVFIGGRNLGDHYLKTSDHAFHDGDVMVCRNHANDEAGQQLFADADASFNELRDDTKDPEINGDGESPVRLVLPDAKYKNLLSDKVPDQARVEGIALAHFSQPKLLVTGWTPKFDDVRFALLRGIEREQNEIFIETAYAEFNGSIRRALEKALARGVKVTLYTNGFFISDGPSKFIRLIMRGWSERMQQQYKGLITIGYESLESGRMIHFKGAGFRCQKRKVKNPATNEMEDSYYRTYMIGSHNFHPRSGASDKEHMLQWNEATDESCKTSDPSDDMIAQRQAYYAAFVKAKKPQLVGYTTLYTECTAAISYANKFPKDKNLAKLADYGRAIKLAMYKPMGTLKVPEIKYEAEVEYMLELLDQSGLRDLVGLFL